MAGHSKWSTIHRKKAVLDAKRGQIFQKLAKELYVAARGTNGDINENPALRVVVEKARSNNMPKENIEKAIAKATVSQSSEEYDAIVYEGYAASGVAIMVDCLTDNRNRTAMLVRSTLTKKGGNLGTSGSVSYLFQRKGVIVVEKTMPEDDLMMAVLDAGAIDFITNEANYEIYTEANDLVKVKESIENLNIKEFITSEVTFVADNMIELDKEEAEKTLELVEALEDIDDVQNVYHNLSM